MKIHASSNLKKKITSKDYVVTTMENMHLEKLQFHDTFANIYNLLFTQC